MSYLRDILQLPEVVKHSDYVVDLTKAADHPELLLERYAITPGIAHSFERSVAQVKSSLDEKGNSAAYIAASFGAGKSQFMGVLSSILKGDPAPKTRPELHPLYARHPWLGQKKLLRLHYNMMGSASMEDRIFQTYVAYLEKNHSDAPMPALFKDEGPFLSADGIRKDLGDAVFFEKLNAVQHKLSGWGQLGAASTWTAETYAAARSSSVPDERGRLFAALARTAWFQGRLTAERFVDFGTGLDIIARHAAALGYEGVILFLDELVLWFASIAGNHAKLAHEVGKLSKLVEGQVADRPIPIISFIARQRQLVDLVGQRFAGEEALALRDNLALWEGRIDKITLEDKNLPAIIEAKVVVPRDADARKKLNADFEVVRRRLKEAEWGTLLGESRDGDAFIKVFPFSPVLVEALVALAQCLQRERTAIRILVEMLVSRLEDFQPGQLVPVGDLFDVLAAEDEPMDMAMRERFRTARALYDFELLPVIQQTNGVADPAKCQRLRGDDPGRGCANCAERRCRAENRLVKTLLLAALVPEVPALKDMTAKRLVALNHGALPTVIPGNEWADAVTRLRNLAAAVGKVRVGDQADPTVQLVLEGVDLKPILDQARSFDSPGARQRKLMEIVYQSMELGSGDTAQALVRHELEWRGSLRRGEVYFGNVRKMGDELLAAKEDDDFRVVIDVPFDEPGFGPADDETRMREFLEAGKSSPTVLWLGSFLGDAAQRDLSELVIIDQLLAPSQLRPYFENRAPEELQRAQSELRSLAEAKRQRLKRALLASFGLKSDEGELDLARLVDRHYALLMPGAEVRGLLAADFRTGLESAIRELLEQRYPRHANFKERITKARLEKALKLFERVCDADGRRLVLATLEQRELGPAEGLGLVQITDAAATLRMVKFQDWLNLLMQEGADAGPTVARLRELANEAGAAGYSDEVLDFQVVTFALATNRSLVTFDGRAILEPALGKLPADARIIQVPLPSEANWHRALERSGKLFGVAIGGKARNSTNLTRFHAQLAEKRDARIAAGADRIAALLDGKRGWFEGDPARLKTARAAASLLGSLQSNDPVALVDAMAGFTPETSLEAMEKHLVAAASEATALRSDMVFGTFEALRGRESPEVTLVFDEVRKVLESDELHVPLGSRLEELGQRALTIIRGPVGPTGGFRATGRATSLQGFDGEKAKIVEALEQAGTGASLSIDWTVTKK